ncbi:response regulator transcription factor [Lachnospiraceae bacterium 50-23]|nr:response regulator ArlR [Lachnospiraceae bacterium]
MRILVVEDEKKIADGLEAILRREGYEVDTVYDGRNGLDYMLSSIYDLVLLDVMLPKVNGLDVLKAARGEGISVPVIILTARSQTEDKILGLDGGADDYLTKPFDAAELLARIRARTRVSSGVNQDRIAAGDIWLEKSTQRLGGKSNSVKLGNKEFQLLECLMINKNQILPRDLLIMKVWGPLEAAEYNNLEVYISFLRKKLRFVKASVEIVTTKGVGYSLEENKNG